MMDLTSERKKQTNPGKSRMVEHIPLFFAVAFFLIFLLRPNELANQSVLPIELKETSQRNFANLGLEAKAAYVFDQKTDRTLFSLNSEKQLPLASLTKIMTALVALQVAPPGMVVTIDKNDRHLQAADGFYSNEKWRLVDLLKLTLIESSNDGAYAAASAAGAADAGVSDPDLGLSHFLKLMNKKAGEIGLTQTYFLNETGLDQNTFLSGAYGSARDVAYLMIYAIKTHPEIFELTRYTTTESRSLSDLTHQVKNTNQSVNKIPALIASKTGFTDLAGGNLAVAFDAGFERPIIVVVLGSSQDGRFTDAEKLAWAALRSLPEVNH